MNPLGKHYAFLPLLALMLLSSCVCVREKAVVLDYQREAKVSTMEIGARKRTFAQPVFFPESQVKYGMFQNYLHWWIDRPLFLDRATRYPSGSFDYVTRASYLQDRDIAKKYEFDGMGILSPKLYKATEQLLRDINLKPDNFCQLAQFGFSDNPIKKEDPNIQNFTDVLRLAQSSPYTARPNGKTLVLTYNTASVSMDKHRQILKTLRDEFGDTFTVAGESKGISNKDEDIFRQTGELPAKAIEEYRQEVQEILDVFGALQLGGVPLRRLNNINGDYSFGGYSTELFRKYLLPVLLDLMKRPENQGRLVGFALIHCYVNHLSGVTDGEYGTARLRDSLDAALLLNPDFLLFFEWNEVNENTCFQPTLCNSMALQRIMKYYFRKMRAQPTLPNPGDDLSIPNLILSHRETLKLGERLQFELLNVPDADKAATYQATLVLRGVNGKQIFRFPVETFAADKLQAVTYSIPSEQLADQAVILPELETVGVDGKKRTFSDFQYVRIQPTMCFNYKATRQPLRDMLKPEKSNLTVSKNADGSYKVAATVEATETLASLEIVDNGSEVAALDKVNEFDPDKNFVFVGTLSAKKSKTSPITIKVSNATNWNFRPWEAPNVSFGSSWQRKNDAVHGNTLIWPAPNMFIITVPKSEVAEARLDIALDGETYAWPLADLVKNHKAAKVLHNCRIDLEKFNKLADVPVRIKAQSGSLTANLVSDFKYPILQVRAVTESGKIFRGKPALPEKLSGKKMTLNVFSETSGKVVPVEVDRERVPVLNYRFDPTRGAMLLSSYESFYDAQLGGGFIYGGPFSYIPLPEGGIYNPTWAKDGNADVLVFDGVNNYINFPLEAFPRGSFTLEFEISMNATEKPQVLFRHFSYILGSISVYVKNGKLCAGYGDRALKTTKFQTDLDLPMDKWTKVKITYDLNELIFAVDGKQFIRKFSGRPIYFKPAVFGGHTKIEFGIDEVMQFFKGKLKNISIKHYVDK